MTAHYVCADICNNLKHLKPARNPKSGENPTFGAKRFAVSLGSAATTISLSYEVVTASGPEDAFQLATDCVEAWNQFLKNHGL